MIFYANSEGTIFKTFPDTVYQGSADASKIVFVAPFAESNIVSVAFQLPHGFNTEPYLLMNQGMLQDNGTNVELGGNPLSVWIADLPSAITKYSGVVKAQFFVMHNATASNGVIVSTSQTSFTVQKGVAAILPETPNPDVYEQILSQLNEVLELYNDIASGLVYAEYAARAIKGWSSTRTYGAGEYVIRGPSNPTIYYSNEEPHGAVPGDETNVPPRWVKVFSFNDAIAQLAEIPPLQERVSTAETNIDALEGKYNQTLRDYNQLSLKIAEGTQVGADSIRQPGMASTVVMYAGRYYFFRNGTENYIMRAKVSDPFTSPFTANGIDETKWEVVFNLGELTDTVIEAVKGFIDQITSASFEIVPLNPETGLPDVETPLKSIIYLTEKTNGTTNNSYDEWIYTNNKWEHIGSTDIDLTGYVTTSQLSTTLSDYATKALLEQTLENYVTQTVLTQTLSDYATKQYVDNAVSGAGVSKNQIVERADTLPEATAESADFVLFESALYVKTAIPVTLGTFTISNYDSYQFEIGMTWAEWVNSSYNTRGWENTNGYIRLGEVVVKTRSALVLPSDTITNGYLYNTQVSGGVGPRAFTLSNGDALVTSDGQNFNIKGGKQNG